MSSQRPGRFLGSLAIAALVACSAPPPPDLVPPETTITAAPAPVTREPVATIAFESSESGATFACRSGAAAFEPCQSPVVLPSLLDGPHAFEVRAADVAGNVDESPARHAWRVDTVPPDTSVTGAPAEVSTSATVRLELASSEPEGTFECRLDDAPFAPCPAVVELTVADGPHVFEARAADRAGNVDARPASVSWRVDTAPPDTALTGAPPEWTAAPVAEFSFESSESGATFECALDGDTFAACVTPHLVEAPTEGAHVFEVRARDAAGLVDASPASHRWNLDTQAPAVAFADVLAPPAAREAVFRFGADEPGCTFACSVDGGDAAPCESPLELDGLADGPHVVAVVATDRAGNVASIAAEHAWTIDATAPETTFTSVEAPPTSRGARFAFESSESADFECAVDDAGFAPCTSPLALTRLDDGSHSVRVRAIDRTGNVDATPAAFEWSTDATWPETVLLETAAPEDRSVATFAFVSEPGATFDCRVDEAGPSPCGSPVSLSQLADGPHTFEVRSRDALGNLDPTPATHAWSIDTSAPETALTSAPRPLSNDAAARFDFAATRPRCSFECAVDSSEFGACSPPWTVRALADGPHAFAVRARNPEGHADPSPAAHEWVVDTLPPVTTIVAAPPDTATNGSARFEFTSEDGATFECRLDGGDFAPCSSPAAWTGLADGPHGFAVRAVDLAGNVEPAPAEHGWLVEAHARIRIMAANISSGNLQSYDPGHGIRIFQGLRPDVVLLQEFNYGTNSAADLRAFVDRAFGAEFRFSREADAQIPNGVISRYPIVESGEWDDTAVTNRDFAWARLDVPGPKDLWVVSVHLLTSRASIRQTEAAELVRYVTAHVPAGDYLVVGGDLNTNTSDPAVEPCLTTLGQITAAAPPAADHAGNPNTNASRTKPYDHLLLDADLLPWLVPVVIGGASFPSGLVFDSRVFTPLADVAPVEVGDSGAPNMQHMAVVREFDVPVE